MAQSITLPPAKFVDAIHGTVTRVTNRVEIYEQDNSTLWMGSADVGLIGGNVGVDQGRDERRTLELSLDNSDNALNISPGGLWYDKVIRCYRGVIASDGTTWEAKLGEFMIDNLSQDHFPNNIELSGRDFTKKLMLSKFSTTTKFVKNQPIEEVIRTIVINGGIPSNKTAFPLTGKSTIKDYLFDRTLSRWEAVKQIADDFAYDLYFDSNGILRLETFTDPFLDPPQYTFRTGPDGNIEDFSKSINDSRLYNYVVVTGGTEDEDSIPPYAIAENDDPNSPTSTQELGRRSYFYTSSFMTTTAQCQAVADKFLKVHALEQFECGIDSIVAPYLEAGITVTFTDPEPAVGQPDKYLLDSFDIPLGLDSMSASLKRVIQVS